MPPKSSRSGGRILFKVSKYFMPWEVSTHRPSTMSDIVIGPFLPRALYVSAGHLNVASPNTSGFATRIVRMCNLTTNRQLTQWLLLLHHTLRSAHATCQLEYIIHNRHQYLRNTKQGTGVVYITQCFICMCILACTIYWTSMTKLTGLNYTCQNSLTMQCPFITLAQNQVKSLQSENSELKVRCHSKWPVGDSKIYSSNPIIMYQCLLTLIYYCLLYSQVRQTWKDSWMK